MVGKYNYNQIKSPLFNINSSTPINYLFCVSNRPMKQIGEVYNVMNLVDKLLDRLHFVTLMDLPKSDTPEVLKDSDVKTIKSIVDNHPEFNLEAPINMPRESIFLVCCENGSYIEGIKYLIEKKC